MKRWRMLMIENGVPMVSTVVVAEEEVEDLLLAEAWMAQLTGWTVTKGDRVVVCRRGRMERILTAKSFAPEEDVFE